MRMMLTIPILCLLTAGCTSPRSSFDETTYGINRAPNTAPRGSEEFCRIYAGQTTANRIESSESSNGRGPSGFDKFIANREGGRAYDRCRAGRTD